MKRYIILIILFISAKGFSQLLDKSSNLFVAYHYGLPLGSEKFNSNGVIAPSYFSNFEYANGFSIKNTFKILPNISAGLSIGLLDAKNWQNKNFIGYKNSYFTTYDIKPIIQFHNRYQSKGVFNQLKIHGELSPVFGLTKLFIVNNMIELKTKENLIENGVESTKIHFGLQIGVGAEYGITNRLGVLAGIAVTNNFVSNPLFIDNKYSIININMGIYYNLTKVKRFKY